MIVMAEVESFKLDYTKVIAPYVRKIDVQYGKKGMLLQILTFG